MKDTLVLIPARAGSKGVPGKNMRNLDGKPLIGYTIDAALEVFESSQICISTNDLKVKEYAESLGVEIPFLRPDALSDDNATTHDVIIHALDFYRNIGRMPQKVVLLQPTSPFRKAKHIKEALTLYNADLDMVVSVTKTKSNPYFVLFEEDENGFLRKSKIGNFNRRQDAPEVWEYNGAIYIINVESLRDQKINELNYIKKYVMDEVSSHDIDTILDWLIAETIISQITKTLH